MCYPFCTRAALETLRFRHRLEATASKDVLLAGLSNLQETGTKQDKNVPLYYWPLLFILLEEVVLLQLVRSFRPEV